MHFKTINETDILYKKYYELKMEGFTDDADYIIFFNQVHIKQDTYSIEDHQY